MKTALVTGGAGFVGSHLCERLLGMGLRVICVDNFFVGSEENIAHLKSNQNFKLIEHNIIEPLKISEPVHWIFNFACPASPIHYQYDPVFTLETNVIGMKNMLELAHEHGARVMQASTSEVYGDPIVHPQPETYWGNVNSIGVRSCYDEGKRAAETLCFDFHREYGVDIRVIRIFNTYGPRMAPNDGRVVTNFVTQALQNRAITIYGDGTYTRSFQYIDDLIEGIMRMMQQDTIIGPVNLGNPNEFEVRELAKIVKEMTDATSEIIFKPLPGDDPKQRQPDIRLAREMLDWEPKIQLREGLEKTIEFFKKKIAHETRIAIFTPAYAPHEGQQEKFVRRIASELVDISFEVFTLGDGKLPREEKQGNVAIYRFGDRSSVVDRIVFPWRAAALAAQHEKENPFQAAWAAMGSYGAFAGWLFKSKVPRIAIFLSLDSNEVRLSPWTPDGMLRHIIRAIGRRAASYSEVVTTDGSVSLDPVFSGTRDETSYAGYRFRQLFYRLGLEKEFGRPFVTMKRLFEK